MARYVWGICRKCIIINDDICVFCKHQPELASHFKRGKRQEDCCDG